MLHWPDSMFTYLAEEKILFSSDAFGQHYAGQEKFDDVIGEAIMPHAKKYFANILMLYAPQVLQLMEKIQSLGLEFAMICPDHGISWRREPGRILEAYLRWARQTPKKKALVVYDTMWHSTEQNGRGHRNRHRRRRGPGAPHDPQQMAPQRHHDRSAGRQGHRSGLAHPSTTAFFPP